MPRLMQSLLISAALVVSPLTLLSPVVLAAETAPSAAFSQQEIEQLVAPIALYPDALLAQVLMASTYPLEVVQAARWRKDNPSLKDKALENALQKQTWDPSVKSLTAFPDVLQMMNDKIDWTQKLGDAVLAQQKDVMEASQRLRQKAQAEGNLKTTKEQKVIVETAPTTVIKIEPATEVVYVPVYNPTVVYGPWPYPYYTPYYWYPPSYMYPGTVFGFTMGVFVGAALWGNCNWGHNDININVNRYNEFNRTNINSGNWNHNVEHRKGVEYRDKATRDQYRPNANTRDQQRDDFRGKADASRNDLKNVDRSALQEQMKDVDRSAAKDRAQNLERDKIQNGNNQIARDVPKNERPSTADRAHGAQQRDVNRPTNTSRDNAFSNANRPDVNRAATDRGMSSQRSTPSRSTTSRPPRSGGRSR